MTGMNAHKLKRAVSYIMALALILGIVVGLPLPTAAAPIEITLSSGPNTIAADGEYLLKTAGTLNDAYIMVTATNTNITLGEGFDLEASTGYAALTYSNGGSHTLQGSGGTLVSGDQSGIALPLGGTLTVEGRFNVQGLSNASGIVFGDLGGPGRLNIAGHLGIYLDGSGPALIGGDPTITFTGVASDMALQNFTDADQTIAVTKGAAVSGLLWKMANDARITNGSEDDDAIEVTVGANAVGAISLRYAIHLAADPADGGNPTVSATGAALGTPITLTANPNPGYRLDHWTIEYGGDVRTLLGETTTFFMPPYNVQVTAHYIYGDGDSGGEWVTVYGGTGKDNPHTGR